MRYDYRIFFESKLEKLAEEKVILDVGGGHPFQKRMAPYRELFRGSTYQTLDTAAIYEPDIIGDAHAIPLPDASVGGILCISVLEHLRDPEQAAREMQRVLKPNGKLLLYTHFIYPYHGRVGTYQDYFRFSEDGLRQLFRGFSELELKKEGGYFRALGFFLPGQAELKWMWEPLAYGLDKLLRTELRSTTAGYYLFAIK